MKYKLQVEKLKQIKMDKKEKFKQSMRDFQSGKIYFEDLLMAFENYSNSKRFIEVELLNAARKKGREIALELFLDDDVNEGVGAGTYSFFEFNGVFFKIEINAFWEKVKHFDYTVKSNVYDEFSETCIEF